MIARRRSTRASRRLALRRGVALVEVMVATVMLGIAVTGLAGMTFWVGRRASISTMENGRLATTVQLVDQLTVLPFDSLPHKAGCVDIATKPFAHRRCIVITDLSPTQRRVSIVIQPLSALLQPDSIVFERTLATPNSPVS